MAFGDRNFDFFSRPVMEDLLVVEYVKEKRKKKQTNQDLTTFHDLFPETKITK